MIIANTAANTAETAETMYVSQAKLNKKKRIKKEAYAWKDDIVQIVIDQWQNEPCLFNVSDPSYHDKVKRSNAFQRIVTSVTDNGFPAPDYRGSDHKVAQCAVLSNNRD